MLDSAETIAAVSTPAGGPAWRAVVRLSGPACLDVAGRAFRAADGGPIAGPGFRAVAGFIDLGDTLPLAAVAWRFRAPASYTGQDMVEFHVPGSSATARLALDRLVESGARPAEPGEFTLRAVLNGRIDLTGAEAVAELIAARSDGQLRAAMALADGSLVRRVAAVNDALTDLLAEVEAGLDFADEPIEFVTSQQVTAGLAAAGRRLADLAADAASFESLADLPTVVLVGRPNAGKSTLLNRLTGVRRALCSPVAGTTRDVLAAPLALDGGDVMLVDAAGVGDEPSADDALAAAARRAALRSAERADLLLLVLDPGGPIDAQLRLLARPGLADRPTVVVLNKCDLPAAAAAEPPAAVRVSALTGDGIAALVAAMSEAIFSDAAGRGAEALALNARHRESLREASAALERAADLAEGGGDLLAGELREAVEQLGRISGRVMAEDILDRIFSKFCLGK